VTGASRRLDTLAPASKEASGLRRARRSDWTMSGRIRRCSAHYRNALRAGVTPCPHRRWSDPRVRIGQCRDARASHIFA
jgi:hypothetical protein